MSIICLTHFGIILLCIDYQLVCSGCLYHYSVKASPYNTPQAPLYHCFEVVVEGDVMTWLEMLQGK